MSFSFILRIVFHVSEILWNVNLFFFAITQLFFNFSQWACSLVNTGTIICAFYANKPSSHSYLRPS